MMRAVSTTLTLGVVLALGLPTLSAQESKGANPRAGTWHLNVAKSKYSPGPAPKSHVLKIEATGDSETVTSEMMPAAGAKTVVTYTATYDGKPYPIKGSESADTVMLKRIDANTSERIDSKNGKPTLTYTRAVSKDGKTMTVTIKGTNAQGEPVSNVSVFEKH
jgi:hypothetical protein